MTLRTSSATRRNVVSRSSVVLTTSATSSRRGSTWEACKVGAAVVFTGFILVHLQFAICNWQWKIESAREAKLRPVNSPLQIFQHANIRNVAIALGIVQAVADHVGIGNGEADVVRLDRLYAA